MVEHQDCVIAYLLCEVTSVAELSAEIVSDGTEASCLRGVAIDMIRW